MWQLKAWIDRTVIIGIKIYFVDLEKSKRGNDSVLLICENIDAHCFEDVLQMFGAANILGLILCTCLY